MRISRYLPNLPTDLDQCLAVGGAVVAVDFADVFAAGDYAGEGRRVVAGIGG